jgi:hypothetical protein
VRRQVATLRLEPGAEAVTVLAVFLMLAGVAMLLHAAVVGMWRAQK